MRLSGPKIGAHLNERIAGLSKDAGRANRQVNKFDVTIIENKRMIEFFRSNK